MFSYMNMGLYTLGDLEDNEIDLAVQCRSWRCSTITPDMEFERGEKRPKVNLAVLIDKLGREHSCMAEDLIPYLRCTKCGQYNASFMLMLPDVYTPNKVTKG